MEIPRALLDEYTAQLNALSEVGQQLVLNALDNAEWESIAELRSIMIAVMNEVCSALTSDAAVIASGMYDDIREMSIGKRLRQIAPSAFSRAATEGAVRALVQSVVKSGDTSTFGRNLAGRVDYEVKRSAGEAPYKLGAKDPVKPRFARVPSGAETCPFCLMLASRGFEYRSEKSAAYKKDGGHYHPNCDCRIVAGFDGMDVEGYDPDALYERYSDCANTVADEHGHADRNAVLNEMARRDPAWLNGGPPPAIGFASDQVKKRALSNPHELRTAERIAEHGIEPFFVQDYIWVEQGGKKRKVGLPDLRNGVEIKTPMTSENPYGALANYLDNARKKKGLKRVVVDNTESLFDDDDLIKAARDEIKNYQDIPLLTILLKSGKLKNI